MTDADDSGVRVTMKTPSPASDAVDEWDEKSGGGATSAIDPEALSDLRTVSSVHSEAEAADFATAAEEFDSAPATVMEDVQRFSPSQLLEAVDKDQFGSAGKSEFDEDSVTRMDPRARPDIVEPEDSLGKEPCPKCGVMVAPGYPNCPRCKSSLVPPRTKRRARAGGTSLGGRTVPWTIVFIAAVVTVIIVYLSEREPTTPSDGRTEPAVSSDEHLDPTNGVVPMAAEPDGELPSEVEGTPEPAGDE